MIAVGASAGGVEALTILVGGLPADLPAAVLVVLHMPRAAPSALALILNRPGPLRASTAVDGEVPEPGRIYVAPADRHLVFAGGRLWLRRDPPEDLHRPAVNPLFRSVAAALGDRVIAVVLSGNQDDGAAGAEEVAGRGGLVVVQDPDDAKFAAMPRAVLARVASARTCPVRDLGALLGELAAGNGAVPHPLR